MTEQRIIDFAVANGYESAEYCTEWQGFTCYEPIMDTTQVTSTGVPLLILVKGNTIRMSTVDEAYAQIGL